MLLTEAPSLRTLRSRPAERACRPGGSSGPAPGATPTPPSSASPKSDGSGSESERRDEVDGGDKWSTDPTGDVADSDISIPARRCTRCNSLVTFSNYNYSY